MLLKLEFSDIIKLTMKILSYHQSQKAKVADDQLKWFIRTKLVVIIIENTQT